MPVPTSRWTLQLAAMTLCWAAGACGRGDQGGTASGQTGRQVLPHIDTTPSLTIAIPDSIGGASADLGNAARLANDAVAIADWDGHRILIFDSAGTLRRVVGRDGSGPGEFRAPSLIQSFGGDSLLIWDTYLKRLSWLDAGSGSGRSISLASAGLMGGNPVIGLLDDGRVVARNEVVLQPSGAETPRRLASLFVLEARGNRVGTVAESLAYTTGDAHGYRFFQPTLQTATDGERILAGVSTEWRIATYSPDGQHLGDLVRPWKPRPVTDIDKAGIRASLTRSDMAPGFLDDDRFDATVPAFGRILPAADGSIWVLAYAAPYQAPDSVSIFSHEGQFLGAIPLPPHFRPTEMGADYVIGLATRDDGDLEIRKYSVLPGLP